MTIIFEENETPLSHLTALLPESALTVVWDRMSFPTATHLITWLMFDSYRFHKDDARKQKDIAIARGRIRNATSPFEVYEITSAYTDLISPDWEHVKEDTVYLVTLLKYQQHYFLHKLVNADNLIKLKDMDVINPDDLKPWFKLIEDFKLNDDISQTSDALIKAPLPAGFEDTPELREKLAKFISTLPSGEPSVVDISKIRIGR